MGISIDQKNETIKKGSVKINIDLFLFLKNKNQNRPINSPSCINPPRA